MFRPDVYTVRQGDTLYAIAWRYERSVDDLVRWNGIDSPDTLYPGQRLRLSAPDGGRAAPGADEGRGQRASTGSVSREPTTVSVEPQPEPEAVERTQTSEDRGDAGDWHWPTAGDVVGTFGDGVAYGRGIDIAGSEGQGVRAAAAGEVVYSGEGLQAYGPLIIIRHSGQYLSAYAHNRRLLVGEGDRVEAGDRIAEMGMATDDRPLLHFEIRRDGSPVDPLDYLPARD